MVLLNITIQKISLFIIQQSSKMAIRLYKTLKEGELVDFKLIETSKGLQAVDVQEKELTTI